MKNLISAILTAGFLILSGCGTAAKESGKAEVKPEKAETVKISPLETFGPVITFPDQNLKEFTVTFYTVKPSFNKIVLFYPESNVIMEEKVQQNYHQFTVKVRFSTTVFKIQSADPYLSEKICKVFVPVTSSYRFAVFGNNKGNPDDFQHLSSVMAPFLPIFAIHTGGLVSHGQNPSEWSSAYKAAEPVLVNAFFIPTPGPSDRNAELLPRFYNTPGMPNSYFSYTMPELKIIVLDPVAGLKENSPQYQWLLSELASAGNRWKIVAINNSLLSSGKWGQNPLNAELLKTLLPVFEKNKVSIVFTGQDAFYERSEKDKVMFINVGGGGASPEKSVQKNPAQIKIAENQQHFVIVDVDRKHLKVKIYGLDKKEIDSFEAIE